MNIVVGLRRILAALAFAAAAPRLAAQAADFPALKSPVKATVLSIVLPGAGQVYAGNAVKGMQILGGTGFAATAAVWAYGAASAAEDADVFNRRALAVTVVPTVSARSLGLQVGAVIRW
jgi:hypothetical protein